MKTQSSNLNNSHKLPIPLSDMLYQYDRCSKLYIDVINDTKALRTLVNEYLSSTVDSEMFLFNKFELRFAGPLLIVLSLDNNELVMINGPAITSRIIFNVDMKLAKTTA